MSDVTVGGIHQSTDYEVVTLSLTTLDGREYDISALVPSLQIYEDIEQPFITASLNLRDATGFVNQKIKGGEVVKIAFRTMTASEKHTFSKEFVLYEFTRREHSKAKELIWQLSLVTKEQDNNLKAKISRSFKNKTSSAIIGNIITDDLNSEKLYDTVTDSYDQKYVIPFKHPFQVISFFKERAVSDAGKASYMFFENRDGYVFKPIEEMAKKKPIQLYYSPEGIAPNYPNFNVIEEYFPTSIAGANIHQNLKYGMEGSFGTYFDMVEKKAYTQGTNKSAQFYMSFSSDSNNRARTWLESRSRVLGEFYNVVYTANIGGSTLRTVGDTIYFNLPSAKVTGDKTDFDQDEKLDGLYIIKRIKHNLEGSVYKQVIEISKVDQNLTSDRIQSDGSGDRDQTTEEREAYKPEVKRGVDCVQMKTSEAGKLELLMHEAIVTSRYRDIKGVWTIGAGVTSAANAEINPETYRGRITPEQAVDMFENVLVQYEKGVNDALDCTIVEQHEFDALVSLAYNVGAGLGPDTIALIREGRIADAIDLWREDRELHDRRDAEIQLALTGAYTGGKIQVLNATESGTIIYSGVTFYSPNLTS